jgi:hypothetical protein
MAFLYGCAFLYALYVVFILYLSGSIACIERGGSVVQYFTAHTVCNCRCTTQLYYTVGFQLLGFILTVVN